MSTPALTRGELYERVWSQPMSRAAAQLGLSGGGLAKICDRMLIPYPPRGYWARVRGGQSLQRPPLPPAPETGETIAFGPGARSRRRRTRVSPEARREQLIDTAAEIIVADGLSAVTMRAVARRAGLSEAQAHNHFPRRADLLLALARRELHAMEERRRAELSQGRGRQERVRLSTRAYLRQVAERGALIQVLTASPEVRAALEPERQMARRWDTRRVSQGLEAAYGLPAELASGATRVLTAMTLRAGRLVAEGKAPLDAVERLTLAMVEAGNRELVRAYRELGRSG